jgi:hypothetical protein
LRAIRRQRLIPLAHPLHRLDDYWSHDGRPITAQEFMDQMFGDLGTLVASEDELRAIWSDPGRRTSFIQRLAEIGYGADRLEDMRRLIDAPNSDIFDVLAYVRFTLAPLSRTDRAEIARSRGLGGYEAEMREFLDFVLRSHEVHGIDELAPAKITDFLRVRYGGTNDAKMRLGPDHVIRDASSASSATYSADTVPSRHYPAQIITPIYNPAVTTSPCRQCRDKDPAPYRRRHSSGQTQTRSFGTDRTPRAPIDHPARHQSTSRSPGDRVLLPLAPCRDMADRACHARPPHGRQDQAFPRLGPGRH